METFFIPTQFNINNAEHVYLLQQILVFVLKDELNGAKTIASDEIVNRTYGQTTQEAVVYFRSSYGIVQTPGVSEDTINKLNQLAGKRYRMFGYAMDKSGLPVGDIKLDLQYVLLDDSTVLMGSGISLLDGSYRIYLDFSGKEYLLESSGLLKSKLCVKAVFSEKKDTGEYTELDSSDTFFLNDKESIQNFSNEKFVFTGDPLYVSLEKILLHNGISVEDLILKTPPELQKIASVTDIDVEILMKLLLCVDLQSINTGFPIETSIVYGYLTQNLPYNLPIKLFTEELEGDDWNYYVSDLRKYIVSGIELLAKEDHISTISNAVKLRYIKQLGEIEIENLAETITSNKYELLEVLPILEGDVSLAEFSENIKNEIVDDPSVWEVKSTFAQNLVPSSKVAKKLNVKSSIIQDYIIARDYENTGGGNCWVSIQDDHIIEFGGDVAYTTHLSSDYHNNGLPIFGSYIGINIRIPEGRLIDPYEFECRINNDYDDERYIYFNNLSAKEISEGYIHIYLNLSYRDMNLSSFPHQHDIHIHWRADSPDEDFNVISNNVSLRGIK